MAKKKSAAGPVVGLDIGSKWIKAVEVRPSRDGATITGIGYEPTPQGAVVEDAILDPAAIGQAIQRLFQAGGITVKKVISSVSGQSSVVVRIIEVPRMSDAELAETMKWEVERHIPFPSSEVVMDFKPVHRPSIPPDAQNMEVLLAVCQEEVVHRHIEALSAAKLTPEAIEVESISLPRSLIDGVSDVEGTSVVAIADIGAETTKVCVYEAKLLVFPRIVPIAGINFVRAISQQLGMDEDEAEQALRDKGSVDLEMMTQRGAGAQPGSPEAYSPDETQLGGYVSPFADVQAAGETQEPEPETPHLPPVTGFDLGDDFVEPPQEQEIFVEEETSPSPTGGVFDLDAEDFSASTPGPVFDLDEPEETAPAPVAGEDAGIAPVPAEAEPPAAGQEREIQEAIASVLEDLASELSRSLEYYSSRNPEPPGKLLLCGGIAKLPGLAAYLESVLGLPVRVTDPLSRLPIASRRYGPEYLAEVAPVFASSVGLALRDFAEAAP